ncbi:MAG TPA: alpha/beta fold hydrolase [Verrucomicrobiae bacterium]|jgi:pimeloyl-ACP methyl ester carboxylesterase|nr:alpha/beta fold hydrolase [Verrucomicrobiae bacterium]
MPKKLPKTPADYIAPLNINGLEGRMLHVPGPSTRKREILLVYGHHAMLERWWGLVENLNQYGTVTMPDLPGFGGMDSFYTIGIRPTVDAFADYLAAFVKLRYRRKRVTIVAISYGFVVVTRMLQRYPELTKKVDLLVSLVGFMHKDDFVYPVPRRNFYQHATRFFATRPSAVFIRYFCLNRFVLKTLYAKLPNSKRRMIEVTPQEFNATMDFEVKMWQANDVRTHWLTTSQFFTLDNCTKQIDLPVMHVVSKEDHYFNNEIVKQHMLVVFNDYRRFVAHSEAHTPSVLADKKAMGVMLPPGLRRILSKP